MCPSLLQKLDRLAQVEKRRVMSWHHRWLVGSEEVAGGAGRSHGPEGALSGNECRGVRPFLLVKGQLDKVLKALVLESSWPRLLPKPGSLACLTLDNFIQPLSALVSISVHLGCCNKNTIHQVAYEQVYFSQFWRLGSPGSSCPVAYGIFLDQESNQCPLQLQGRFCITGPPGKPWGLSFKGTNFNHESFALLAQSSSPLSYHYQSGG